MKSVEHVKKYARIILVCGVLSLLSVVIIVGMISCGKLSDDTSRPSSPIGTSGGQAIPIGPQSSWGTYALSLDATPSTIPADMATFTTLHAKLTDTSGRSLQGFIINFEADLGYIDNSPTGPSTLSLTGSGVTNQWGSVSLYYYGARAGSSIVKATADLDSDGVVDLTVTTLVLITQGAGVPGTGVPGVKLTVDTTGQSLEAGDCTQPTVQSATFKLTAKVWDKSGGTVGAGARVELSGDLSSDLVTWGETDSTGQVSWTFTYGGLGVGSYKWTVMATTTMDGVTYTSSVTFYAIVTCTPAATPTPVPTATPIVVTLAPTASTPSTGGTTSTITIIATVGGAPAPVGTRIQLAASGGTFTSSGSSVTVLTTGAGGIVTDTLNYLILVGRPTPITVTSSVLSPYSGSGNPLVVTFP